MFRWPLPLAIVALMAVPASAADRSITATAGNEFSPADVTISVSETVAWSNGGGFHNVKFEDGSFEQPAEPDGSGWTVQRTFDTDGTFRYYCEAHGGPNGSGMSGRVHVVDEAPAPGPYPTEPGLAVTAPADLTLKRLRERGAGTRIACENGCDATLKLSIAARTAKRFGFRRRLTVVGSRAVSLAPRGSRRVTISLTRRARRKLAGARRQFKLRLDVAAKRESSQAARRTIAIKP